MTALDSAPRAHVALSVLVVLGLGGAAVLAPLPQGALLATTIVLLVVSTVLLRWLGARWSDIGFTRPPRASRAASVAIVVTLILIVTSQFVLPLIQRLTGAPPDLEAFDVLHGNLGALIGGLVVVWTLAAFGEELLVRGFLMQAFARLMPDRAPGAVRWGGALVTSSVLFGLAHAYQGPTGMLGTGFIGTGFGVAYLVAGRNLWPAILAHGLYDTAGFLALFFGRTPAA